MKDLNKKSIIYIFDPFCSWCYAMSDVISKIEKEYSDDFDFIAMTGGMVLNDNVGSINDNFSFLKEAINKVEAYTGCKFGPEFKENLLEKGEYVIDSLNPSIAIRVFKSMDEINDLINFIHKLQDAFYFDGKDIKDISVILDIVNQFNIDTLEFRLRFEDESYKKLTLLEFDTIKSWGISGYPTILLKDNDQLYLIASGFQYLMDLKNIIKQIKSQN